MAAPKRDRDRTSPAEDFAIGRSVKLSRASLAGLHFTKQPGEQSSVSQPQMVLGCLYQQPSATMNSQRGYMGLRIRRECRASEVAEPGTRSAGSGLLSTLVLPVADRLDEMFAHGSERVPSGKKTVESLAVTLGDERHDVI